MVRQVEPCNRLKKEYYAVESRDQTGNSDWRTSPIRYQRWHVAFFKHICTVNQISAQRMRKLAKTEDSFIGSDQDQ